MSSNTNVTAAGRGSYVNIFNQSTDGGKTVTNNVNSPSLLSEAQKIDEFLKVVSQVNDSSLSKSDVQSSSSFRDKFKMLTDALNRLYPGQSSSAQKQRYNACEKAIKRLKQSALAKQPGKGGAKGVSEDSEDGAIDESDTDNTTEGTDSYSFAGEDGQNAPENGDGESKELMRDDVLETVSESLANVSDQDNVLQYLVDVEDYDIARMESEIRQTDKMLQRLEGHTEEKAVSLRRDIKEKRSRLESQVKFSKTFKQELLAAKSKLNGIHGQEIADGYNVIPKAADLYKDLVNNGKMGDDQPSAISSVYQKALASGTLADVLKMSFETFGPDGWKQGMMNVMELCGVDIKSINPSHDVEFLISVRDLLFRAEMGVQVYESVGDLQEKVGTFLKEVENA